MIVMNKNEGRLVYHKKFQDTAASIQLKIKSKTKNEFT